MGKTLTGYLEQFQPGQVAQFYIHSEVPTDDRICTNYYRFTDTDAVKSVFQRWRTGHIFSGSDISQDRTTTRVDSGAVEAIYVAGSRRRPITMALRELAWLLGSWKSSHLKKWLTDFSPDVIFFAAGDYMFTYRIALWVSKFLRKPLVLVCTDDYYCHNRNSKSWLGRFLHNRYLKTVRKTLSHTKLLFAICDNMAAEYSRRYHIPCRVLHTGAVSKAVHLQKEAKQISYIGNMGFQRYQQLIRLSEALQRIDPEYRLDVYSPSKRAEETDAVQNAPGIRFHGSIPADEVLRVMERSMAVIHTESFDEQTQNMVRFSVSTKIAESLMYGPCLLAYGPEGIASIDYLKEHNAAYVITDQDDPEAALWKFLNDRELREIILKNARALAQQNHDLSRNSELVYHTLQNLCGT